MPTIARFLMGSFKGTSPSCKTLFITLSLITFSTLIALLALHVTTNNHSHICNHASNPSSCISLISKHSPAGIFPTSDTNLLRILLKKSVIHVDNVALNAAGVYRRLNDSNQQVNLANCMEIIDLSRERLDDCKLAINSLKIRSSAAADDVYTWLAGVVTNHVTCLDGLSGVARSTLEGEFKTLIDLATTSVAIVSAISPSSVEQLHRRRDGDFPAWLKTEDRTLVRARDGEIKADVDVVVAKDGSGNFSTIQEAVAAAPEIGEARYVIYVKKGKYEEKVVVGKKKRNVVIVGDGMDSTIVTGSLNVADGSTVFSSATFVALGDGFMAHDIWFQNTAGPEKRQAVALLVGADQSVINRCRVDSYHNTLWAHSLRHFYRNCMISGTIDLIFGDALVVLQNCKFITQAHDQRPEKNLFLR